MGPVRGGRGGRGLMRLVVTAVALGGVLVGSAGVAAATPASGTMNAAAVSHARLHVIRGSLPGRGATAHSAGVHDSAFALSTNWSGQVATGGTYNSVAGMWTVPTVTNGTHGAYSATWIGIDGTSSTSLIQTGTAQQPGNGTPAYYAWYELLPNESIPLPNPVSPGDAMSASITYSGNNNWIVSMADMTKQWFYNGGFTYATPRASAEWVEEAPTVGVQTSINDYGTATFTGMQVQGPNTGSSIYTPVYLGGTDALGNFTGITSWPDTNVVGNSFTVHYGSPTPVISSISPATGSTAGGNPVTISGQYVFAAADVYFGVAKASAFYLNPNGSMTVATPAGTGTVDILLTSDTTSSAAVPADQFTYASNAPRPTHGYWLVGSDGGIFSFGSAGFYGSTGNLVLQRPVVGITPTADRKGYWLVATDGGVFAFGDAGFYGSIPGLGIAPAGSGAVGELDAPIVGIVPSVDDRGYFMVAADGGVFAFGDAGFEGSCPGIGGCSGTAVSVMPDASGGGYWLVTDTGYVYDFGNAYRYGQPTDYNSGQALPAGAVTSAVRTADGHGYWILIADGFVLPFGDANIYRATHGDAYGTVTQGDPATTVFATGDKLGYWIASGDGSVFEYGDAPADGSMAGHHLNGGIIAATGW